ncbi:MAG: GntR family transcriptional regulator [Syntrophomonadaceae bacterium]|nr:GntR family transcriptional regulator [Syntrophomonadaceae bacterium]
MVRIDYKNPQPLFEQVRDGIRELIVDGVLRADDKIPSVRELAMQLSINPNTIQKSYRELEREGYIYQVSGRGSFVAPAEHSRSPQKERQLCDKLLGIARELHYMGMAPDDIKALIDKLE